MIRELERRQRKFDQALTEEKNAKEQALLEKEQAMQQVSIGCVAQVQVGRCMSLMRELASSIPACGA